MCVCVCVCVCGLKLPSRFYLLKVKYLPNIFAEFPFVCGNVIYQSAFEGIDKMARFFSTTVKTTALTLFIYVFGAGPFPGVALYGRDLQPKSSAIKSLDHREIFRRSISDQTGEIFLLSKRGNFMLEDKDLAPEMLVPSHIRKDLKPGSEVRVIPAHPQTMHGYAWDYDLEIPLSFYDPQGRFFKKGKFPQLAVQQDIAPTLSVVLGIAAPPKSRGRVLTESLKNKDTAKSVIEGKLKRPKAILIFVQDQVGRMFLKAHPDRVGFFGKLLIDGAEYVNAQVAHVDVETAVGHAAVATGGYPRDTGVSTNSYFHTGVWQKQTAFAVRLSDSETRLGYPGFYMAPTLSDVWVKARSGKPKVLSLSTAARASMAMGGHGSMFKDSPKTNVVFYEDGGEQAGTYITDSGSYEIPKGFVGKKIDSTVEEFLKDRDGKWFGHTLKKSSGKIDYKLVRATPAQSIFDAGLVVSGIEELEIGKDDETDLVWLNMKATDYCGHAFGFESEECGDVLSVTAAMAQKVVEAIAKATGGDYLVVFTADHGAAPLPELSGAIRMLRSTFLKDINEKFDKTGNGIDVALSVTSSQLFLNEPELKLNGFKIDDVVKYLRNYEVPMVAPLNALADEWIAKGTPAKVKFFEDVISAEELLKPSGGR